MAEGVSEQGRLTRSPAMQAKVDSVRQLPIKIDGVRSAVLRREKREAARLLRMEMLLINAWLTDFTLNTICNDPLTTRGELTSKIQSSGRVVHPDAVDAYLDEWENTKEQARKAVQTLHSGLDSAKDRRGERLFKFLVEDKTGHSFGFERDKGFPKGKITIDTNYPLAIILWIEKEEDFALLDPRENVGGFFQKKGKLIGQDMIFPLIVVNGDKSQTVEKHEKGHSQNALWFGEKAKWVIKAWGRSAKPTYPAEEGFKSETQWHQQAIEYALACAKDEILAEMSTGRGSYVKTLINRPDLYDYFVNRLGVPKGSKLRMDLWDEYTRGLQIYTNEADRLFQHYNNFSEWEGRRRIFRWVLAQFPIDQWPDLLRAGGFLDEWENYAQLRGDLILLAGDLKADDAPTAKLGDSPLYQQALELQEEMEERCRSDCTTHPLFKLVVQTRERYDRLLADAQNDPIYQINTMHGDFAHMQEDVVLIFSRLHGSVEAEPTGRSLVEEYKRLSNDFNQYYNAENGPDIEGMRRCHTVAKKLLENARRYKRQKIVTL